MDDAEKKTDAKDSLLDQLFDLPLSLYRLSPLHFSPNKPVLPNLKYYANLIAKHFKRVGPYTNSKVGTLKRCKLVSQDDEECEESQTHRFRGILIQLEFEKKTVPAFLLRAHDTGPKDSETCIYFPLLLSSVPSPGNEILLESLAATFGTYLCPLKLSTQFLQQSLDDCLDFSLKKGRKYMEQAIEDISFTLDFTGDIQPSLKGLDFSIKREDLFGFIERGHTLLAQKDMGPSGEKLGAFTTAVRDYMHHNLAMDLSHKSISIAKIACGSFVLGKDGKVKLLSSSVDDEVDDDAGMTLSKDLIKEVLSNLLKRLIVEAEGKVKYIGLEYT